MSFFFFKQKTAYEICACLVGSEMCIRDSYKGEDVIVRFNTSCIGMPLIATVSCYAARAIHFAALHVTLSCIDEEQRSKTEERVVTPITQWPTAANEFDIKTIMALYYYAKRREVQLTLEVAITDTESVNDIPDASTIEERCAGVVEQRFDEAVEFSPLTRNPYNRR